MAQPTPMTCDACGAGGIASDLLGVKLCSACSNIASKNSDKIDAAVKETVITKVKEIAPRPVPLTNVTPEPGRLE